MKIGFESDPGKVRDNNEDWLVVDEDMGLFLVADGMGGHQAGEVASRVGGEKIHEIIRTRLKEGNELNIEALIREACDTANKELLSQASNNPDFSGMGTTVVLGLFQHNEFYIVHVGDSRAYLINSQNITLLTEDHSLVAGMVSAGRISEKEARSHKMLHIITQCLGSNEYYGPDIKKFKLDKGEIILLCSDGLTDMVEDDDIRKVVNKNRGDLQNCAKELVKLANKKGGKDNITLILAEND